MPTTIAHAVGAAAAVEAVAGGIGRWRRAAVAVVAGNLADLDFLPGLLIGSPRAFHRGPTHSVVAAVLVAAAVAWAVRASADRRALFLLVLAAYGAHLGMDVIVPDTYGAAGIPLFWPLSDAMVALPVPLPHGLRAFLDLELGETGGSFIGSLLTAKAAMVFVVEGLLFLPLLAVAIVARRWLRRHG